MQIYRFEKADVPEDEELDTFVEALMELRVSLSTYKEMCKPIAGTLVIQCKKYFPKFIYHDTTVLCPPCRAPSPAKRLHLSPRKH